MKRKRSDEYSEIEFHKALHQEKLRNKENQQKKNTQKQLNEKYDEIENDCYHAQQCRTERDKVEATRQILWEEHKSLIAMELKTKFRCILLALLPILVCFINTFINFHPSQFLAQLLLGQGLLATTAGLCIPIIILLFQLSFSALMVKNEEVFKIGGRVILFITPGLLIATWVAKFTTQGILPGLPDILFIFSLFALALVTDLAVIHGYDEIAYAYGFVWYSFRDSHLKRTKADYRDDYRKKERAAIKCLREYVQLLDYWNKDHPNNPIESDSFSLTTVEILGDRVRRDV